MDAKWIITAFVLIDMLLERLNHRSHKLAQVPDSEVLTVAVVAAKYFQNHHERALCVLRETHYLSGRLELTRFNRRLHALSDWLAFIATTLGEVFMHGEVFVIDSIPLPVCRRVRARRTSKPLMTSLKPPAHVAPGVFASHLLPFETLLLTMLYCRTQAHSAPTGVSGTPAPTGRGCIR